MYVVKFNNLNTDVMMEVVLSYARSLSCYHCPIEGARALSAGASIPRIPLVHMTRCRIPLPSQVKSRQCGQLPARGQVTLPTTCHIKNSSVLKTISLKILETHFETRLLLDILNIQKFNLIPTHQASF